MKSTQSLNHIHYSVISLAEIYNLINEYYFPGEKVSCYFLKQGVNDTYEIWKEGVKYFLRITKAYRFLDFDEIAYQVEHDLLFHLKNDSNKVAQPMFMLDGTTLGKLKAPEGQRYFSLFEHAPGIAVFPLSKQQLFQIGQGLAKIHVSSKSFGSGAKRPQIDKNIIQKSLDDCALFFPILKQKDVNFIRTLGQTYAEQSHSILKNCQTGLIHGDFWWDNLHCTDKEIHIIDFDYCSVGYLAYDIATFIGTAIGFGRSMNETEVANFIKGYQSVNFLNQSDINAIHWLVVLRFYFGLGLEANLAQIDGAKRFILFFDNLVSVTKKVLDMKHFKNLKLSLLK
jgi:Ser/Thr protein kinase RdoA (MazF antagonist)